MIQDLEKLIEIPESLNTVESVTELFSTLSVKKFQLYPDSLIQTELQRANLTEDDSIKYAATLINSSISTQQMTGAVIIRRLLSKETGVPFQKVIQANILPTLIQLIPFSDEQFSCEVLWIISNFTAGDKNCVDYLFSQRSLELFNFFLEKSSSIRIFEQMMWAVGNIAGEGPAYRDEILYQINIQKIIYFLNTFENDFSERNIKTIAWCIYNLIATKPLPDSNKISLFLPFLQKIIIKHPRDEETLADAMNSYAVITDKIFDFENCFNSQFLYEILSLLDHSNTKITLFSLRTIGNYSTGEKIDRNFILTSGLFPKLIQFIDSDNKAAKREAYWVLSNLVLVGNSCFSQLISSLFFEKFKNTFEFDSDEVIKEAIWVVCNFSTVCNFEQAKWIIENGILEIILRKLLIGSVNVNVIFEGVLNYFKFVQQMDTKEILKYSEILENAKIQIGNNKILESILQRLRDIDISNDISMT
ncbi:unnamed protein product [Blepharisma stoltei]|uniref:Importin subunit alpha n=1 Tax=Blepharisma stoltei TaxID=1481888 RepID=A0AAU9IYW1_9CILI|nr:unnamed protein product [Blepharisma stoltei]